MRNLADTVALVVASLVGLAWAFGIGYLSIWVFLIGGIAGAINEFNDMPVDGYNVTIHILMAIFFEVPLVFGIWGLFIVAPLTFYGVHWLTSGVVSKRRTKG